MTRIISFANQKGGVGKSTLCLQMAFYLAKKNKRVLVIDFDPQGNTSSRLAPKDEDLEPIFTGTSTKDLFEDVCENITPLPCPSGVDLIYSLVNDAELSELESVDFEKVLLPKAHLKETLSQYDYVLIDCPPSLGRKLVAALIFSTHVLCPVQLSGFAVDGVEGLLKTILSVQRSFNRNLKMIGIAINKMDTSISHTKALEKLEQGLPNLLLKNIIKHRPPLDRATSEGVPIWSLSYGHVAAKEVKLLLDEVLQKVKA